MVISGKKCRVLWCLSQPGLGAGQGEEASLWMPPGPEIRPVWWTGGGSPGASPHLSGPPVFLESRTPPLGKGALPARGCSSHAGPLGRSVCASTTTELVPDPALGASQLHLQSLLGEVKEGHSL